MSWHQSLARPDRPTQQRRPTYRARAAPAANQNSLSRAACAEVQPRSSQQAPASESPASSTCPSITLRYCATASRAAASISTTTAPSATRRSTRPASLGRRHPWSRCGPPGEQRWRRPACRRASPPRAGRRRPPYSAAGSDTRSPRPGFALATTTACPKTRSGSKAPAPPQTTSRRQPMAITSSRNAAASGAPTPGWKTASRRPDISISQTGFNPASLDRTGTRRLPGRPAISWTTSPKKTHHRTGRHVHSRGDPARLDDTLSREVILQQRQVH